MVTPLYLEEVHFLINKKSGIHSIEDLKGKRISLGHAASGTFFSAKKSA